MNNGDHLHNIDKNISCILTYRLNNGDADDLEIIKTDLVHSINNRFLFIDDVDYDTKQLLNKLRIRNNRNLKEIIIDLYTEWRGKDVDI